MAKRFAATELWEEDWFLEMPTEYKLFWFYMLSACNHAGFYRLNLRRFCVTNDIKIDAKKAIELFNFGKERIKVIKEDLWYVTDFITFQYGHKLNMNNRVHLSIIEQLNKFNINVKDVRGLIEVVEKPSNGHIGVK